MPPPSPPLLILIVPTIAFFLWLIANPSFLSPATATHKVKPSHSIRWDSLNIFLVVFAILCGVFARKNDDDSSDNTNTTTTTTTTSGLNYKEAEEDKKRTVSNPPSWFDQFSNDRTFVTPRLKRSSSSYPDLRQESWENNPDEDQRFRFFDDFEISSKLYASSPSSEYIHHRRNQSKVLSEETNVKEIPVDTFVLRSTSPSPPPPPPPPPPRKRVYKTIPRKEKPIEPSTPPPPPPPPPRPPPSPLQEKSKYVKNERKRTNATKEIKIILASLYNQRKRKKKYRSMKKTNVDTYDNVSVQRSSEQISYFRPPPSPPPPPPPPPPSMFHNLFRKGSHKSKKIHSFSAPPPPPPPPPKSKSTTTAATPAPPRKYSTATGKPPLPTRVNNFYEDNNVKSGNQSPLIPMPPPPPPPPFKVQGFRFVVAGDFVRIRSASSSRCGSPEREVGDEMAEVYGGAGGGASASVSCPSPDVNVKADSFIARLRDEWRMEKMNSWREKGVGPSPS